jgi:hypothetical protein
MLAKGGLAGRVIQRTLRALALGVAALVAAIVGAVATAHAVEPGFTGTFLYRNDNFRTGQNLAERLLTPSTVNAKQFGLKFTDAVDGFIYAEPLYVPNVTIPSQGTHNVVYVATENDSVYAFDADVAGPPLWQTSFIDPDDGITPVPVSDLGPDCMDLTKIIGITATPVIDPSTGTLYVLSKVKLGPGSYQQQLHALDITTGLEQPNSPVTIAASVPGTGEDSVNGVVTFDPLLQHDRAALTLTNGVVYLTFASHCDITPYHGWILGYDETTLAQVIVYNDTPNGLQGGIWESGCGPGVDTNGDLIAVSGNGTFDTGASPIDYGDSFMRLTPGVGTTGTMTVASFFTPLNELILDDEDADMGSGGNLLLPDQPGPNPHLMIGIGKLGAIYLVNRDSMGGFNASMNQMVQEVPGVIGGMFSTPAYWQGKVRKGVLQNMLYTVAVNDAPKMFVIANGMINRTVVSVARNFKFGFPGASPVISANNTTGGIVWAVNTSNFQTGGTAILYAFDATNLENELYDSNQNSGDQPGPAVKFTVPTVANGSVYVGTQTQLAVYGMFPSKLIIQPASLAFGNNVSIGTTSKPKTVTITNSGHKRSMPVSIAMESASPSQFAIKSQCEKILKPHKSCKVSVTFRPISTTPQQGALTIVDNDPNSPHSVSLSGTGKPAGTK